MNSQTVERLVMELEIELGKFRSQAQEADRINEKLKSKLKDSEKAGKDASGAMGDLGDSTSKASKVTDKSAESIMHMTRRLTGMFAAITSSFAMERLATGIAQVNSNLEFMERRLGLSAQRIRQMGVSADAMGGSASGMEATMRSLNQSIQEMVLTGDTSMLPFFNALGVGVVDAQGKIRDIDSVMLDLADAFSSLDPQQAYAFASAMGIDDGVANVLIQGRDAIQDMLGLTDNLYVSTQQELEASRTLIKNQALLRGEWKSLTTMLGNAMTPALIKLTEIARDFTSFLLRNESTVKNVFEALAYVAGTVAAGAMLLLAKATFAAFAPILGLALIVAGLSAAFIGLYDDYKVWAAGGKSLFDWSKFKEFIDNASFSVDNLTESFVFLLTGYKSVDEAIEGATNWLKLKGFIDENGVSVRSLGTGFKNLARDIYDSIPILKTFADIISKLLSGDFKGAFASASQLPIDLLKMGYGATSWVTERIAGAADTVLGVDPESDASLSGGVRGMSALGKRHLNDVGNWVGGLFGGSSENRPSGGGLLSEDQLEAIQKTADNIGVEPNDLAAIISFETGGTFDTNARNPHSSATGLIQFMAGTGGEKGKYYGMTRDEFGSLSFEEQMAYVEKYFKGRGFSADKKRSVHEAYSAVTGWGYKKGSKAYELNKVWDSDGDGYISQYEMAQNPSFRAHQRDYFGDYSLHPAYGEMFSKLAQFDPTTGGLKNERQGVAEGVSFARSANIEAPRPVISGGTQNDISVNVGGIVVNTSASNLPDITNEGLSAAMQKSANQLDQLGAGL